MTWKTLEEIIRRGRNRYIKAWLVTGGDDIHDGICLICYRYRNRYLEFILAF
jgi:hypothetical protein